MTAPRRRGQAEYDAGMIESKTPPPKRPTPRRKPLRTHLRAGAQEAYERETHTSE